MGVLLLVLLLLLLVIDSDVLEMCLFEYDRKSGAIRGILEH